MKSADDGKKWESPAENKLEKILREKFGNPGFDGLMNSIVDKMLSEMEPKDGEKRK